ncbi:MAG: flagellar basal body rod protein FlgC [Anaerolineaceae bacterium]|nr:flagellar basal body rod protein FlgC [Anaerolineaceae bacterium]
MSFWKTMRIGSSALHAQRLRLDVISNNIANAETTRTDEGGPYQRQDVVFSAQNQHLPFAKFLPAQREVAEKALRLNGVQVEQVVTDTSPGSVVYDPTHPDADEDGNVSYPNVNMVIEMTNMLSASRSYEANVQVISASRTMAQRALEIGR